MTTATSRDRCAEADVLAGLVVASAELLEIRDWDRIEPHVARFDWAGEDVARPAFWAALGCSMIHEIRGDEERALASARRAETLAPDGAYRAFALCRIGAVFRGLREHRAHREFTLRAAATFASIGTGGLSFDQRDIALALAREFAYAGASDEVARAIEYHRDVVRPAFGSSGVEPPSAALEHEIHGLLLESAGENARAIGHYAAALDLSLAASYRGRAVATAIRLAKLTGSQRYLEVAQAVLHAYPHYWLATELAALRFGAPATLTVHQTRVLRLVAEGKTYKEIGAVLGRSWRTVNNTVEKLRVKFDVASRGELVAEAMRRGMLDVPHRVRRSASA